MVDQVHYYGPKVWQNIMAEGLGGRALFHKGNQKVETSEEQGHGR